MKSLKTKIIVGLILLCLLVALAVALFTAFNTRHLFSTYLDTYVQTRQEQWSRVLAEYYDQNRSWSGVNRILPVARDQHAPGLMRGRADSGELIVLTDPGGRILTSTRNINGQQLSENEMLKARPIISGDNIVGFVYIQVDYELPGLNTLEKQFLNSVLYSSLGAGLFIALLAALFGVVISNRLTRPLKDLTETTKSFALGKWDVKIDIKREDEIGQLASSFNSMAKKLKETELARKTLVADVAHELRNPLAILRAQLESIQEDVTPIDSKTIYSLNDEVIRLSRLVNDLQELSLAEVGRLRLNKEFVDLGNLLKKVSSVFSASLQEKSIELVLEIDNVKDIEIDPQRITQVLVNLLSNAIRHTPKGGKIILSLTENHENLSVIVFNEGEKIAPEDLPFLFERFYRADKGRTREQGGTGLGLAITKGLITAHSGEVGIENLPNGVKLYFTLPK